MPTRVVLNGESCILQTLEPSGSKFFQSSIHQVTSPPLTFCCSCEVSSAV